MAASDPTNPQLQKALDALLQTFNWVQTRALLLAESSLLQPEALTAIDNRLSAGEAPQSWPALRALLAYAQTHSPLSAIRAAEQGDLPAPLRHQLSELLRTPLEDQPGLISRMPSLLTDEAQAVLLAQVAAFQAAGDENTVRVLQAHADLLQQVRDHGLVAAFGEVATQLEAENARKAQLAEWLATPDNAAKLAYLTAHPELLSAAAVTTLENIANQHLRLGNLVLAEHTSAHAHLLELSIEVGPAAAIQQALSDPATDPATAERLSQIAAFANSDPATRPALLSANPDLAGLASDIVLTVAIGKLRELGDQASVQRLTETRTALRHFRATGHLDLPSQRSTIDPAEARVAAIQALLAAPDWPALQTVIHAEPTLLDPEAISLLAVLENNYAQRGDFGMAQRTHALADLLHRCQQFGLGVALAGPPPPGWD